MAEMQVQAELAAPGAVVQIALFVIDEPVDTPVTPTPDYRLNFCLTPRPRGSRAAFPERWGLRRFEPLGKLFHLPPSERMHVRSETGRQTSVICNLQPEAANRWLDEAVDWTDRRLEAGLDISSPHIRNLLLRLAEETHRPGFASAALVEHACGQIAIELARFVLAVDDGPVRGGLAGWRLRAIDERLREVHAPPTLAELAGLCNLSVRQLTRAFRASRGASISSYVVRVRMETAKRLLIEDQGVKAIAFAMGFGSPSSFAYAFRREVGVTPRQFRQRMKGGMR